MFGRLLCLIGWHDWVYRESGCTFHLTRAYVRHNHGAEYLCRCQRCGIRP